MCSMGDFQNLVWSDKRLSFDGLKGTVTLAESGKRWWYRSGLRYFTVTKFPSNHQPWRARYTFPASSAFAHLMSVDRNINTLVIELKVIIQKRYYQYLQTHPSRDPRSTAMCMTFPPSAFSKIASWMRTGQLSPTSLLNRINKLIFYIHLYLSSNDLHFWVEHVAHFKALGEWVRWRRVDSAAIHAESLSLPNFGPRS